MRAASRSTCSSCSIAGIRTIRTPTTTTTRPSRIHNKGAARQSWTDPTFDDLATKAAAETDKTKRLDLYYQAETRMQTQFAYMPIHWRTDNLAIKPYAQSFPKNKQGYLVYNTNIFGRLWDSVYVTADSKHDPAK